MDSRRFITVALLALLSMPLCVASSEVQIDFTEKVLGHKEVADACKKFLPTLISLASDSPKRGRLQQSPPDVRVGMLIEVPTLLNDLSTDQVEAIRTTLRQLGLVAPSHPISNQVLAYMNSYQQNSILVCLIRRNCLLRNGEDEFWTYLPHKAYFHSARLNPPNRPEKITLPATPKPVHDLIALFEPQEGHLASNWATELVAAISLLAARDFLEKWNAANLKLLALRLPADSLFSNPKLVDQSVGKHLIDKDFVSLIEVLRAFYVSVLISDRFQLGTTSEVDLPVVEAIFARSIRGVLSSRDIPPEHELASQVYADELKAFELIAEWDRIMRETIDRADRAVYVGP